MFFADDCYIFCKANIDSATNIIQMLEIFEKSSGQQINVDKSSVLFSRNGQTALKHELCQHLNFNEAGETVCIWVCQVFCIKKMIIAFGYIKEKL